MITPGDIDKLFVDLDTNLKRWPQEFAMEAQARIEQRTPVLSGALKGGWGTTMRKGGFDIWNTKDYAAFVEFGTPKMAPVGMIRTTLLEKDQITEIALKRSGIK